MEIAETAIPEVKLITPRRFEDARGWFAETWSAPAMAAAGLAHTFVQDNHSLSRRAGTLRGLHYQAPPFAQAKLVRAARGAVLDVAVDIRVGSPTYLRWVSAELSAENGVQILVPRGFLHGFITLTDDAEVLYKCDALYSRDHDGAVRWDDPAIGVDWGAGAPLLSDKDRAAPLLSEIVNPFVYEGGA